MTSPRILALALAVGACSAGCRRGDDAAAARAAVRRYLDLVVEAYRMSDAAMMDPHVSEQQALKLTGLIGVKRDAGVYLDARLEAIEFTRTERLGARWVVETRERWTYRDRVIGSGAQFGEASADSYAMRYYFSHDGDRWVLQDLQFAAAPVVGRKAVELPLDVRTLHGLGAPADGAPEPGPWAPKATPPPAPGRK